MFLSHCLLSNFFIIENNPLSTISSGHEWQGGFSGFFVLDRLKIFVYGFFFVDN